MDDQERQRRQRIYSAAADLLTELTLQDRDLMEAYKYSELLDALVLELKTEQQRIR